MRALLLLLALSGASAAPVTFTKTYSNAVEVLQWTDTQGALTGTFQQVLRTDSRSPAVKTQNTTFTGTRNGATVTLRFTQSFLGITDTQIWTGTLNGNTLKVTWPLSSGGLNTVVYTRSSPDAYNAAVTTLTRQVEAARTQFARQQEQERAERAVVQAHTEAVEKADRAARRALENAATLSGDISSGVEDVGEAVELLERDLAALREDQAELLDAAEQAKSCYDVNVVKGYQLGVLTGYSLNSLTGYDTNNLAYHVKQLRDELVEAQETLTGLQAATQAYRTVPQANPRSQGRLSFQPEQVAQAQASLQVRMEAATTALSKAQARHQAVLTEAKTLVEEAKTVAANLTCQPGS